MTIEITDAWLDEQARLCEAATMSWLGEHERRYHPEDFAFCKAALTGYPAALKELRRLRAALAEHLDAERALMRRCGVVDRAEVERMMDLERARLARELEADHP